MRTNSIYAPYRAVQKTWTIRNRYGHTYAKICIFRTVSPSNGRCLNSVTSYTNMKRNEVLFASSSPRARRWPRRCRACRCGRLEDGVHNSLSCQNRYKMVSIENFSTISPHKTEVFKPCKKSINALAHLWDVEPQRGGKASVERWRAAAGCQCVAGVAPGRGRAPGRGSRPAWCRSEASGRGVASRRGGRRGDGARRDGSSARAVSVQTP